MHNPPYQLIKEAMESSRHQLMQFNTGDPDEFADKISGIAPDLSCNSLRSHGMKAKVCGAQLPSLGIFRSTIQNFQVQSPIRSFYSVTIPLAGHSRFLVAGNFGTFNSAKAHLQYPGKKFNAKVGEGLFESLQFCFDQAMLNSIADKVLGVEGRKGMLLESLDLARPVARSFARHALFLWSEILRGGPMISSPLIAQESVQMLGTLLVSAACPVTERTRSIDRKCSPVVVQRAEEYLMENLLNPISIADVAVASGMSARTLSRAFGRHHGTTIKGFIKERRLEAANRILLAAAPGETNVTKVALDLGFDQLGRFSAEYRQAFGELPSQTLTR